MSIDTLGRSAGAVLRQSVTEADTSAAFERALRPPPRRHRFVVAAACTAGVLLLLWVVSGGLPTTRASDPVAPAQGTRAGVGSGLPIPLTFEVPEGYEVTHDGGFVSFVCTDKPVGSAIFVGVPNQVYDPKTRIAETLDESLLTWILGHPYLDNSRPTGVQADGWLGSTTELAPRAGEAWRFAADDPLPLVALRDSPANWRPQTIGFARSDRTFSWTVLAVGEDELLVVTISPKDADVQSEMALTDILESLDFEQEAIIR